MASYFPAPVAHRLRSVRHIIIVLAGKGGVGKSSVSAQLALSLYASSPIARVGILDIDLTGPSIPRMLGLDGQGVYQSTDGWVPVYADGAERRLACMSVGFLLKGKEDSVVWRGPKKNGMIRQFLSDVRWGYLDYLVIDTPPGTSDEHLSLLEHLAPVHDKLFTVVVTTPQAVALADALKCVSFIRAVDLPVLGLIENMSGYVCPCCGEVTNVFSTDGGQSFAERENIPFLGALPIDTELVTLLDGAAEETGDGTEAGEMGDEADETGDEADETGDEADETGDEADETDDETGVVFRVLERYQKTNSAKLFGPIVEEILRTLPRFEQVTS